MERNMEDDMEVGVIHGFYRVVTGFLPLQARKLGCLQSRMFFGIPTIP